MIKFLRQDKQCRAKRLLSEFPTENWSLSGLNRLLRKTDETGSAERLSGQGRKRSVRTHENNNDVADLVLTAQPG